MIETIWLDLPLEVPLIVASINVMVPHGDHDHVVPARTIRCLN